MLKKGGVQIKQRVDVGEAGAWVTCEGTAPGCGVWECRAQKGRALTEHVWAH